MCSERIVSRQEELSMIEEQLKKFELPGTEGEYNNQQLLLRYQNLLYILGALHTELRSLTYNPNNAIINEEATNDN